LASLFLAIVCILSLSLGTWHKLDVIHAKEGLLGKIRAGQETVDANNTLTAELLSEYENLRPVLAGQQNTVDTLRSLDLLQLSRSNRPFWYVLIADQNSYFSQPPAFLIANRPSGTNAPPPPPELAPLMARPALGLTNATPARPGLIAELFVPGEAEASRQTIRELVNGLKQAPLFSKVDLLSDDLRRGLADSRVVLPDRDFVLELNFESADFHQPVRRKMLPPPLSRGTRRTPRPSSSGGVPEVNQ
jgi:hypothetical protein